MKEKNNSAPLNQPTVMSLISLLLKAKANYDQSGSSGALRKL